MTKIFEKKIVYLLIILFLFLSFRIPLLNKPLQHDEIRNTFTFLNSMPFFHNHPKNVATLEYEFGWADDWKGQLAIHPPFLSSFYYAWIRIFGDSEISLHIPTLIFGIGGIILFYYIGVLLFGAEVSFFALLATTLSVSHIGFSTMTVHAIFELFILGASLLCFIHLLTNENRVLFRVLIILNILGLFIFYHYFAYLLLQTVILWFCKDKFNIPRYYFICFILTVGAFACLTIKSYFAGYYAYSFWMKDDLITFVSTIMWLPFGYAAERVVTQTTQTLFQSLCFILFMLFLWGSAYSVIRMRDHRDRYSLPRTMLLTIFFLPFITYLLVGIVTNTNFGNSRNFFYLLPIYYFFIFDGVVGLVPKKKLYPMLSVFFIALLTIAIVASPILWKYKLLEKEMPRLANKINADFNIIATEDYFINSHYVKKYDIQSKSFLLGNNTPDESDFLPFLDECIGKMPNTKTFTVIEKLPAEKSHLKNRYFVRNKTFELTKTDSYQYHYLPFQPLQKLIKHPLTITTYTFSRK